MNNEKLKEYLDHLLMESSVKVYYYEITRFVLLNSNAALYDYQKVMEYIEELRKRYSPNTINKVVAILKVYYDYLIKTGERKDNPARAVQLRDYKNNPIQLQDLFSEKELESLLEPRKERYPSLTKRNQIIISLLVHQALKVDEIVKLKTTDIYLEKAQLKVTGTAQTNNRILPLKAEQIFLFHTYLQDERLKLLVFSKDSSADLDYFLLNKKGTALQKEGVFFLMRLCQKKINKTLTGGTIRQSVIANLLSKGTDLRIVQEFAGHKYLDTTEKYKQSGIKALQNAIEKHHPIQ
jgi:site-specific recombinase XerD